MTHKCRLFYCDHVRDGLCCRYCKRRERCANPCLNRPETCGQRREKTK